MFQYLEPPPDLEVIVVTASVKPTGKDKLNQAVELLSREDALTNSLGGGIGESLEGVEGVRSTFYGPSASRPIIRGLGEDRIRLLTNFIQGVDASNISPDHAVAMDGMEAQSIEILKGASALRFGANAVGGIVNLIDGRLVTKLPKDGFSGDLFLGHAGVNQNRAVAGKIKYKFGNFLIGFDAVSKKSEDYKIPGFAQTEELRAETLDDTFGEVSNSYGRVKIHGLSINYVKPDYYFGIAKRDEETEYGIPGEDAHIELEQSRYDFAGGLNINGLIEKITLNGSVGDYSHGEIEESGEIGTLFNSEGYEVRLEARHKPIGGIEGLVGIQNGKRDFEAIGEEAFLLPVTIKNQGIFFSEIFEKGNWGFEFGARHEKTDYSGTAGNREFDSTSASFGGFFEPFEGVRTGITISKTERIPTETELFADGPHAATQSYESGDPNLKTEIAKSVELALKVQKASWNIELNVWSGDFDNFIIFENTGLFTAPPEEELPIYQAVQKDAELKGFEAHISKSLGELGPVKAHLDFGIDHVRGKFADGTNIPRIPPMAYHFGINLLGNQSDLRIEFMRYEKQDKLGAFETLTEGKSVINASFNYELPEVPGATISFVADNLTNEEVREHTSVLKDQLPKPGRNIKLGIHWKF